MSKAVKVNIPWARPFFSKAEQRYVSDAVRSTWVSRGPYAAKFETQINQLLKSKHGVATSNGTASLYLALLGLSIGRGDEVIVPGLTFVAPANMVLAVGAKPVFADIDPLTWCISPQAIEKKITAKTKAIIVVHLYGNVCDMKAILAMARKHRLRVIEDTAEAIFSKYDGKYVGTLGDVGCFSFHAAKTITTGEGGFITTQNAALHAGIERLSDQGRTRGRRYWHDMVGFNFRITDLQAAVGCGQLASLPRIMAAKKKMHHLYVRHLNNEAGIVLQHILPDAEPLIWVVAIKIDPKVFGCSRDALMAKLLKAGIETRPGFYPFNAMPFYKAPALPVSAQVGLHVICLPLSVDLTAQEIQFICRTLLALRKD